MSRSTVTRHSLCTPPQYPGENAAMAVSAMNAHGLVAHTTHPASFPLGPVTSSLDRSIMALCTPGQWIVVTSLSPILTHSLTPDEDHATLVGEDEGLSACGLGDSTRSIELLCYPFGFLCRDCVEGTGLSVGRQLIEG